MNRGEERDLLNPDQIDHLLEGGGDHSVFHELVELYDRESGLLLEEMELARRLDDVDRFLFIAHTFRGCSLNMGAVALVDELEELETRARVGSLGAVNLKQLECLRLRTTMALRSK